MALRVWPTVGVPEIVGGAVFEGGVAAVVGAVAMAGLGVERATAEPPAFVAVTTWRTVAPTSAVTSEYVAPLAPGIAAQAPAMQRSQLRAYVIGVVPDQVPTVALRVWPTLVVPDTVGVAVLAGGMGGGGGDCTRFATMTVITVSAVSPFGWLATTRNLCVPSPRLFVSNAM